MTTDQEKEQFLIGLAKEYYTQGDSYFAVKGKKGNWSFGYSNDYPLQHGSGSTIVLPDKMVEILFNKIKP
jgi:hypothetical protein